jgi:hypothetical protein
MSLKQFTIPLVPAVTMMMAAFGCYDLEEGSIAKVLGVNEEQETEPVEREWETEWVEWGDCPSTLEQIEFAKTGDHCSFNVGFGCDMVHESGDLRLEYANNCINGGLALTRVDRPSDPAPNTERMWDDCSAIVDGGRSGEACSRAFSCYRDMAGDCLEIMDCDPSSELYAGTLRPGLVHLVLCDEVGPLPNASDTVYDSCDNIEEAAPLDACEGAFLCQVGDDKVDYQPVQMSEDFDGYSMEGDDYTVPLYLVECDGERLHFYNYSMGIM